MAFAKTLLLFKKGDRLDVANYRRISLLSVIYKVLTKVLARRIGASVENSKFLPPEQAGFRRNFSTTDHIHSINMLAEKRYEHNQPLYVAFIDFRKAFDTVELDAIWQALKECDVDEGVIQMVKLLYSEGSSAVEIQGQDAKYDTEKGVRQGDTLSPLLFILTLQLALNRMKSPGLRIDRRPLRYLAYADDVAIPAANIRSLTTAVRSLATEAAKIGLEINMKKTVWMRQSALETKYDLLLYYGFGSVL
uniref:Reverse transcriptase domain-containing protein n=1 Tax=Panagrellus redivivus TaxID=6233 RepID=A0A7E4ZW23_PANRE